MLNLLLLAIICWSSQLCRSNLIYCVTYCAL